MKKIQTCCEGMEADLLIAKENKCPAIGIWREEGIIFFGNAEYFVRNILFCPYCGKKIK